MRCERCHNEDPAFFYHGTNGWYCRKCVMFRRLYLQQEMDVIEHTQSKQVISDYSLSFLLTTKQQEASCSIVEAVKKEKNALVIAVTGAGKTELVYESIRYALNKKWKVGFAIPRRQVVLQIAKRIAQSFVSCHVVAVCEGHTQEVYGDIVVCTTHQLYRYTGGGGYFDLLILDEPDAFPYADNSMLISICENACKRVRIEMSATFEKRLIQQRKQDGWEVIRLSSRPSGKPLPIPNQVYAPTMILWIRFTCWLLKKKREGRFCLVFFPSIRMMTQVAMLYRHWLSLDLLHSQCENKETILERFSKHEIQFLFTTTVLERGVTFPKIDVAIMYADHMVYTMAGLVQIAGRVGRSVTDPRGEGVFFCRKHTIAIESCIEDLKRNNADAFGA